MSEGYEEIAGVSSDEAVEEFESSIKHVHPDDRQRVLRSIEEVHEHVEAWQEEYRYQHSDGTITWVLASSVPEQQPDGSVIWYGIIFDITDRKEMEQELRLKERAMASLEQGISISDARRDNNPLIYVNNGFEQLTGYSKKEALGRNCRFLQGPETDSDAVQNIRDAISAEETITQEILNYHKDGSTFWNQLSITPIYDDQQRLTHFVGIQKDITEKKKTEKELAKSERRFRQMAENIEQSFFLIAPDFSDVLYVNRASERLYGVPREKQLNDPMAWIEHVHPEDAEEIREDMEIQRKKDKPELPANKDFRVIHPERGLIWLRTTMKTIENDDGEVVRIVGITSDVTEQKQTQDALKKSERRFRNLVENLDQVFWVTDPNFEQFEYVSPRYEDWWNESVDNIYDDKFSWQSRVHPEDVTGLTSAIQQHIIEADSPEEYREFHQEFRIRKESGDWRWCYASGTPVLDDQGRVQKVIGLVSDITDSKRTQKKLSESLEEKHFLLQEVHHRVKNNLQVLLGLLSLQSRRVDSEEARVALGNSKQRILSMALIHEKLYNSDHLSQINVGDYFTELVEHIVESNVRNDLTIQPEFNIDAERMDPETVIPCGLIVNELVTNAVKHGFPDGGQQQITVTFQREESNYRLSVSDSGAGGTDDLFESQSLGLTLVENLTRHQLHGDIDVDNSENGLTISILFPAEQSE